MTVTGTSVLEAFLGEPLTAPAPDAVWTVIAYDLNTNSRLCELPANGLTFDTRLNDSGSIAFNVSLADPGTAAIVAPILAYDGNPFALFVDLDGVIVWGGIAWTGLYTKSTGVLQIGGKEFLSYFDQRLALQDYSSQTYPAGVDPAVFLGKVLSDTQAAAAGPGGSIGLSIFSAPSSIPALIPGYPTSQQTLVSSIISDVVTAITPGFGTVDLLTTCAYDRNGNPTKNLAVVTPRAGRSAGSTGLVFDLSSCVDYTWPEDASQSGNVLTVVGSGNGSATPLAVVNANVPLGGLGQSPRLDLVVTTTAQTQSQVQQMANGSVQQYGKPVTTPTVTVLAADPNQPLGSWVMGDDALIVAPPGDNRFPNGKYEYWRIIQASVTVPDAGPATVQLTFNRPPVY